MQTNQQRTLYGGAALIALGVVAALHLWWLLPVILFAAVGVVVYTQQRRAGRLPEAVQGGLWGVGLALMLVFGFWWSGLAIIGGLSLLARGREQQIDEAVQRTLGRSRSYIQPRSSSITVPTVTHPTSSAPHNITIVNEETSATGETTRLHR